MSHHADQLNRYLRRELAAVETYKLALEWLPRTPHATVLRNSLRSHEGRVVNLRSDVVAHGGTPVDGASAWSSFLGLCADSDVALGEADAIAALEEGEERARNDYESALASAPAAQREVVAELLAAQRRTHAALSALRWTMTARPSSSPPR